jgi:polar amino acid transport system permease protein
MNLWWFFRDAFNCVILAFTLNEAAYLAEILRGSIQAVPRGQTEAAQSLGIPKAVTFWKVVMPQAMIIALRPFGNEIILMIKASAVASVVTVFDLMGATRLAFARSFNFDIYLWAALIYLSMVEVLRRVWDRLETRLTRHIGYGVSK